MLLALGAGQTRSADRSISFESFVHVVRSMRRIARTVLQTKTKTNEYECDGMAWWGGGGGGMWIGNQKTSKANWQIARSIGTKVSGKSQIYRAIPNATPNSLGLRNA